MKVKVIDGVHLIAKQETISLMQMSPRLRDKALLLGLIKNENAVNTVPYLNMKFSKAEHYKFNPCIEKDDKKAISDLTKEV